MTYPEESTFRIIESSDQDFDATPYRDRSDAQKAMDSILEEAEKGFTAASKHIDEALQFLAVTDGDGAARFRGLSYQVAQAAAYIVELKRLRG